MRRSLGILLLGFLLGMPAAAQDFETTEVAEGVYQFRWRTHNAFVVVTPSGVVTMDPVSSEAAVHLAAEIARVAPGAGLAAIVYSHHHADHATGASVLRGALQRDAPIIAHENAYERIVAAGSPDLPPPDVTLSERMTLHIGGRTIELHYVGPNHSDDLIVAYLPEERVLFAVDLISNDRVAFRDFPGMDFPGLFEAIDRLSLFEFDTIVFGHGPPGDRAALERQARYYRDLRESVAQAIARGLTEEQAAEEVRLPEYEHWSQYDAWFPHNVRGMYRWLADLEDAR